MSSDVERIKEQSDLMLRKNYSLSDIDIAVILENTKHC